jgi:hypothetical protein
LLGAWGLERIFSFGADDFMGMIKYIWYGMRGMTKNHNIYSTSYISIDIQ